jgi:3-hydroxyacyl-[acyl-carrier-protein] dehydratase
VRYFLLDKITAFEPNNFATGVKNVSLADEVLHDHFPDHPIFPGALLVEAMAQLAGFLLEAGRADAPERAILAQIEKAKFHAPAGPGDQILLKVTLGQRLEAAAQVEAEAHVGERCIARARLTFMLRHVESARVTEQRAMLYQIWTRELGSAGGSGDGREGGSA